MYPAEEFLTEILSSGPVSYRIVKQRAADAGVRKSELRNARISLSVRTRPVHDDLRRVVDWEWYLP